MDNNYSILIRESYASDNLHTLIINNSSGRVVHLAFSIHYLLMENVRYTTLPDE
jgi:hypothetical protein